MKTKIFTVNKTVYNWLNAVTFLSIIITVFFSFSPFIRIRQRLNAFYRSSSIQVLLFYFIVMNIRTKYFFCRQIKSSWIEELVESFVVIDYYIKTTITRNVQKGRRRKKSLFFSFFFLYLTIILYRKLSSRIFDHIDHTIFRRKKFQHMDNDLFYYILHSEYRQAVCNNIIRITISLINVERYAVQCSFIKCQ